MKTILVSACTLFLAACHSSEATRINEGNGPEYLVECNGENNALGECFKKANDKCPDGYNIVSQNTTAGEGAQRNLRILCKGAK